MANPVVSKGMSMLERAVADAEVANAAKYNVELPATTAKVGAETITPVAAKVGSEMVEDVSTQFPTMAAKPAESIPTGTLGAVAAVGATTVASTGNAQAEDPLADQIQQALLEGYSQEEVSSYLQGQIKTMTPTEIQTKVRLIAEPNAENADTEDEIQVMNLADKYKNLHERYGTTAKLVAGIVSGKQEWTIEARKQQNELNGYIAEQIKKTTGMQTYVDPENGTLMMQTQDGKQQPVDSSFINDLANGHGELIGAIGGAIAGSRVPGNVWVKGAGAIVGGGVGAATGRAYDMLRNAAALNEDISAGIVLEGMVDAGAANAVFDVLGLGAIKSSKAILKGTTSAWKYMTVGNTKGAMRALTETSGISKDEAAQIVKNWEDLNQMPAPGATPEEQAIAVAATTRPEASSLAQAAVANNPQATYKVVSGISERAKGLHKAIADAKPEEVGAALQNGLASYQKDVKDFYGMVKNEATDVIDHTDYRFNLDKVALEPVLNRIGGTLENPNVKQKFVNMMDKINNLTSSRTFSDLLELRQTVNEFKYGTKIVRKSDYDALNSVINKVDGEIQKAAKEYLPNNGKAWLGNWSQARSAYSDMLKLEDNVLYAALTKPGVTEEQIQKILPKFMTSIDDTFTQVVDKLPPQAKIKAEIASVKYLADKFSQGTESGFQAVDFPELASQLNALPLKSAEAKNLANVVNQFAKVYRNDVGLARLSGQFNIQDNGASHLSSDLLAKAKYATVGAIWRHISKLAPTQYGRNMSLVSSASRLLENPMNARAVDDLLKQLPSGTAEETKSLVRDLQVQYSKQAQQPQPEKLNLYKVGTGAMRASDGALGKGVYMTERVANPGVTEQGKNIIKYPVNRSQLATMETISNLVGRDITVANIRQDPTIAKTLMDNGYVGISHDGKAMIFDDAVIEHGSTRAAKKTWSDPSI